jgi:hypothetical protein
MAKILPYSIRHIERLLPSKYKEIEKRKRTIKKDDDICRDPNPISESKPLFTDEELMERNLKIAREMDLDQIDRVLGDIRM